MGVAYNRRRILLSNCLITLCIGSLYAWSAFASPLADYLSSCTGKEIKSLAIVFTIANAVGPITMITGGYFNDRFGPKKILFVGGVLFGVGMIGAGLAKSVAGVVVSYGIFVGLAVGMLYGVTTSNTVKFYPDKSGIAGGIITACYGGSSVIVPPIATVIANKFGVTAAFKGFGIVMMAIICLSALFVEDCPKDYHVAEAKKKNIEAVENCNYKEMLRQTDFYIMICMLLCGAFSGMMVISQASQIAQKMLNISVGKAAMAVSILALFNTAGRLLCGALSDKIKPKYVLRISFIGTAVGGLLLLSCGQDSLAKFYVGIAVIGICFGSIMGVYPGFTASRFGYRNNSVNYGIMFVGFALAGLFAPMIMNRMVQAMGRYQPSFGVCIALALLGEAMTFVVGRKK